MTTMIIAAGVLFLLFCAALIGTSIDTEVRREQARRIATQRRLLAAELRAVRAHRWYGRCAECPHPVEDELGA